MPRAVRLAPLLVLLACSASPPQQPVIQDVAPGSLPAGRDAALRVTGSHLDEDTVATFDGVRVPSEEADGGALRVLVPAALLSRPHLARLVVANGPLSAAHDLQVFAGRPQVDGFDPPALDVGGAGKVAILGSGFLPSSQVTLGTMPIPFRFVSNGRLEVELAAELLDEPGFLQFLVQNDDPTRKGAGDLPVRAPRPAVVEPPAQLPVWGDESSRTQVTLTGSGFYSSTAAEVTGPANCWFSSTDTTHGMLRCEPENGGADLGHTFQVQLVTPPPGGGRSEPFTMTWVHPVPQLRAAKSHYMPGAGRSVVLSPRNAHPEARLLLDGVALDPSRITRTSPWFNDLTVRLTAQDTGELRFTLENPAPGGGLSNTVTVRPMEGTDAGEATDILVVPQGGDATAAVIKTAQGHAVLRADGTRTPITWDSDQYLKSPDGRYVLLVDEAQTTIIDLREDRPPLAVPGSLRTVRFALDGSTALLGHDASLDLVQFASLSARTLETALAPRTVEPGWLDHPTRVAVAASGAAAIADFEQGTLTPLQAAPVGLLRDGSTVVEATRVLANPARSLPGAPLALSRDGTVLLCRPDDRHLVRVHLDTGATDTPLGIPNTAYPLGLGPGLRIGSAYFDRGSGRLSTLHGARPDASADGRWVASMQENLSGAAGAAFYLLDTATGTEVELAGQWPRFVGNTLWYARRAADGTGELVVAAPADAASEGGPHHARLVRQGLSVLREALPIAGSERALLRDGEGPWLLVDPDRGLLASFEATLAAPVAVLRPDLLLTVEQGRAVLWPP